jgi:8-oxo-dGTP pyrophosphatase MutT (NUDIX family)
MPDAVNATNKLSDLLTRYHAADDLEAANCRQTLRFLAETKQPLDRNRFDPGHAVGSAMLCDLDRKHVMLVMHAKLKRWLQPGGHAEPGETDPLLVACREAWEEVCFKLDAGAGRFCDIDVHQVPARKGEPPHLHYDFRYLFAIPLAPTRPASDALDAKWFTVEEALNLDIDEGLRRMIGKLRA